MARRRVKRSPPWEFLLTSKVRHSSVGWNPVHRIFKHLEELDPGLRQGDRNLRLIEIPRLGLKHWCAFQAVCHWNAAPALAFDSFAMPSSPHFCQHPAPSTHRHLPRELGIKHCPRAFVSMTPMRSAAASTMASSCARPPWQTPRSALGRDYPPQYRHVRPITIPLPAR